MTSRIQQAVGDRVADLSRRLQNTNVAPIGEHSTGAVEHAIHGPRKARGNRLEPARQVACAARFDDHVHVVALDRVMNQTEATAVARLPPASLQLGYQLR
jgi:hypothetical protein